MKCMFKCNSVAFNFTLGYFSAHFVKINIISGFFLQSRSTILGNIFIFDIFISFECPNSCNSVAYYARLYAPLYALMMK